METSYWKDIKVLKGWLGNDVKTQPDNCRLFSTNEFAAWKLIVLNYALKLNFLTFFAT